MSAALTPAAVLAITVFAAFRQAVRDAGDYRPQSGARADSRAPLLSATLAGASFYIPLRVRQRDQPTPLLCCDLCGGCVRPVTLLHPLFVSAEAIT